jgi:hypothetical protein
VRELGATDAAGKGNYFQSNFLQPHCAVITIEKN